MSLSINVPATAEDASGHIADVNLTLGRDDDRTYIEIDSDPDEGIFEATINGVAFRFDAADLRRALGFLESDDVGAARGQAAAARLARLEGISRELQRVNIGTRGARIIEEGLNR